MAHGHPEKLLVSQMIKELAVTSNRNLMIFKEQKNSVALVRKRSIPTERPPLLGEVSANFCG
jgi:hypothetical protein